MACKLGKHARADVLHMNGGLIIAGKRAMASAGRRAHPVSSSGNVGSSAAGKKPARQQLPWQLRGRKRARYQQMRSLDSVSPLSATSYVVNCIWRRALGVGARAENSIISVAAAD
eukprot:CAMPEP_0174719276 /NCGR_PEP_ID=MMETSP1094-20130205/30884_1 /TAXON_ID=156173 /ORGANISM="Chrysochromulina brevifilum, Strain UTEX LB 985" /LENGTH=114 /DNA_ID=CAMNT_0015919547 /DNA_START=494 /DNA_END=836 /DNA_ORIENTATION=-